MAGDASNIKVWGGGRFGGRTSLRGGSPGSPRIRPQVAAVSAAALH